MLFDLVTNGKVYILISEARKFAKKTEVRLSLWAASINLINFLESSQSKSLAKTSNR